MPVFNFLSNIFCSDKDMETAELKEAIEWSLQSDHIPIVPFFGIFYQEIINILHDVPKLTVSTENAKPSQVSN